MEALELTPELAAKRDRLLAVLGELPGVAVAFSGGIDSTVERVPDHDTVVMHKLMIEGNEREYLRIANRV